MYYSETPYGSSTAIYSQPTQSSAAHGPIPVMTWNPSQQQSTPNGEHRMRSSVHVDKPMVASQHFDSAMVTPRPHSFPVMPAQTPMMSQRQQQPSTQQQEQQQPKLTTSFWEDEGTICYQVDARGICVARRQDNDMVNGTKLLNVVGMSRGKRDGILKNERGRVVVKVGAMHLKGVWITISRAKALAAQYNISDLLHPLFTDDPAIYFYAAPPPPPPMLSMPPGYYYPHPHFAPPPPPPPPQYLRQAPHHSCGLESDAMAHAPSIPSMAPPPPPPPSSMYNYPSQRHSAAGVPAAPYMDSESSRPLSQFSASGLPFEMENASGHSLIDYASRAGGSSSMLSGITAASDSAPTTPGSQQYHNQMHMMHPYDNNSITPNTSTSGISLLDPPSGIVNDNQMIDEYGRPVNMFMPQYYNQQQQQCDKWFTPSVPPQQPW